MHVYRNRKEVPGAGTVTNRHRRSVFRSIVSVVFPSTDEVERDQQRFSVHLDHDFRSSLIPFSIATFGRELWFEFFLDSGVSELPKVDLRLPSLGLLITEVLLGVR